MPRRSFSDGWRYTFVFDAASCTGCKACQVACKDKNQLATGVLWRRVYEVTGGEWQQQRSAWTNTVFAYNVSVSCNHCAKPACVAACPTGAYDVRDDGLVLHDADKCIGCQYCGWTCPYGAPQYSFELGRMSKCDFCADLLEEGLPPACVAACPMRALDIARIPSGVAIFPAPFPLPADSRTEPQVAITPHPGMTSPWSKAVANREEVRPVEGRIIGGAPVAELPLAAFTLLAQAAAGLALVALAGGLGSPRVHLAIGVLIVAAGVLSLFHLGRAASAWRAAASVTRSPLSREVILLAIFGCSWIIAPLLPGFAGRLAAALCGGALVHAMASVYRIDAVPPWNTWRIEAAFAGSALVLGTAAAALVSAPSSAWLWLFTLLAGFALAWSRARFYASVHQKTM